MNTFLNTGVVLQWRAPLIRTASSRFSSCLCSHSSAPGMMLVSKWFSPFLILPSAELLDQRQEPKKKWNFQEFPPGQNGTTTITQLGRAPEVQDWLVCQQPLYSPQVCRCSQTFLTCQHQYPEYNNWAGLLQLRPKDLSSGELLWFPFVFPGFPVPAGHVPVLKYWIECGSPLRPLTSSPSSLSWGAIFQGLDPH